MAGTDLDWLIVRPGTLVDAPGTGRVNAGVAIPYGLISRDDVAAFLAAALFHPDLNRTAIEVTAGDVPVALAADRLSPRPWPTSRSEAGPGSTEIGSSQPLPRRS